MGKLELYCLGKAWTKLIKVVHSYNSGQIREPILWFHAQIINLASFRPTIKSKAETHKERKNKRRDFIGQ